MIKIKILMIIIMEEKVDLALQILNDQHIGATLTDQKVDDTPDNRYLLFHYVSEEMKLKEAFIKGDMKIPEGEYKDLYNKHHREKVKLIVKLRSKHKLLYENTMNLLKKNNVRTTSENLYKCLIYENFLIDKYELFMKGLRAKSETSP